MFPVDTRNNPTRYSVHLYRVGHVIHFGKTYQGDIRVGAKGHFIKDGNKYRDPSWSTRDYHLDLAGVYSRDIIKRIQAKEFIKRLKIKEQDILGCVRIQNSIASIYFRDNWI